METKRRSSFSSAPILDKRGEKRLWVITPLRLRQLSAMARYPFIDAPWLAALTGCSPDAITNSFMLARAEPNAYVKLADYQLRRPSLAVAEKRVYQITKKGETILRQNDMPIPDDEYSGPPEHRLMSCKVRASFELGAMHIIPWSTIKNDQPDPYIPLTKLEKARKARADCYPFIVVTPTTRHYFPGVELDRATESIEVKIRDKYNCYLSILENKMYRRHLFFNDLTIPIVTVSRTHMQNMMDLWMHMAPEKFRKSAIFKVFRDEPSGWALNEPWQCADGSTVMLNQ